MTFDLRRISSIIRPNLVRIIFPTDGDDDGFFI